MVKPHKFPTVTGHSSNIVARNKDKVNTQVLAEEFGLRPGQVNRIYKRYKQIDEFNIPFSNRTAITFLKSMDYSYKKTTKRDFFRFYG